MLTIVTRVAGALLALVGLALTAVGVWFATQLGTSGTAEFTARPGTVDPVLIRPDVLNRVDADVVVTATPAAGGSVWMALANPSDASAVVGGGRHVAVTGVDVQDWALRSGVRGSGEVAELGAADLWRLQEDEEGPVTLTVRQENAPETLVVLTDGAPLRSLALSVTNKTWFVEAVIAALVGLFLLVAGVTLLFSRRRPDGTGGADGSETSSPTEVGEAGTETRARPGALGETRDAEEVAR
jgi:hypothetical protein